MNLLVYIYHLLLYYIGNHEKKKNDIFNKIIFQI